MQHRFRRYGGNLARSSHSITNEEQEVVIEENTIGIVPVQPQYIYVRTYDPNIIYYGPALHVLFVRPFHQLNELVHGLLDVSLDTP